MRKKVSRTRDFVRRRKQCDQDWVCGRASSGGEPKVGTGTFPNPAPLPPLTQTTPHPPFDVGRRNSADRWGAYIGGCICWGGAYIGLIGPHTPQTGVGSTRGWCLALNW